MDTSAAVVRVDAPASIPPHEVALRACLVRGDYEGLEVQYLNWLMTHVPQEHADREELRQQIRFFCLEAMKIYDPSRKLKFTTFLYQHLKIRCTAYQQYLWVRSSGNENCRLLPISLGKKSAQDWRGGGHFAMDNSKVHLSEFSVLNDAEAVAVVNELVAALSEESRDYLVRLLEYEDQDKLCKAFGSKKFRSRVSRATGLSTRQVDVLAREVRSRMPDYLEV